MCLLDRRERLECAKAADDSADGWPLKVFVLPERRVVDMKEASVPLAEA